MTIEEYAAGALSPPVYHELKEAVANNRWLEWRHLDQVSGRRGGGEWSHLDQVSGGGGE